MNLDEYQRLALRTANIATYTEREIFTNACLGLIGETGEVADIFKKTMFQGHALAPVHLVKELGDVGNDLRIYGNRMCRYSGIDGCRR